MILPLPIQYKIKICRDTKKTNTLTLFTLTNILLIWRRLSRWALKNAGWQKEHPNWLWNDPNLFSIMESNSCKLRVDNWYRFWRRQRAQILQRCNSLQLLTAKCRLVCATFNVINDKLVTIANCLSWKLLFWYVVCAACLLYSLSLTLSFFHPHNICTFTHITTVIVYEGWFVLCASFRTHLKFMFLCLQKERKISDQNKKTASTKTTSTATTG